MNNSLANILFTLVIFQLVILCIFLFTQHNGKQVSNRLLGCFFLSIALNLLDVFILNTGFYFAHSGLAGFGSCLPLLFGPLLYFYTRSIIYKNFSVTLKSAVHFLPFLVFFSVTECYYLIQPHQVKETILKGLFTHQVPVAISVVSTLIFIQFLFYIISSFRLVSLYKRASGQLFSDPRQTDVSWLYSTLVFFIVIMIVTTLNGLLVQTFLAKYFLVAFNLVILAMLVFVIQILMKALRRSYFFSFSDPQDSPGNFTSALKTNLTTTEKGERQKIVQSVLHYMQTKKPYLEPELTLDQLASQLSIKPRVLSQAINDILQQNFFDFVNRYRIEDAKRLLTNPADKKITILEVLYQVGFNSKSSFNTLFKKYTGLTPTEFRQQQVR